MAEKIVTILFLSAIPATALVYIIALLVRKANHRKNKGENNEGKKNKRK